LQWIIRMEYLFQRDPRLKLMLREPRITDAMLKSITAKTLVLAGSEDIIQEKETRHIAAAVPGAELRILEGEGHGSYIIHNTKIAEIISDFCNVKS
nr:alpha/beta hydrolase [Oscillospiraceae bacterium]